MYDSMNIIWSHSSILKLLLLSSGLSERGSTRDMLWRLYLQLLAGLRFPTSFHGFPQVNMARGRSVP